MENPDWKEEGSGLFKHAKRELEIGGYFNELDEDGEPNEMNKMMAENVLELIRTFAKQGHSGFSAPFCLSLFKKLADYKPLTPLTGEDSEWMDISGYQDGKPGWQNIRAGNVFKDENGAYDINGKIFEESDGARYTSYESRVPVNFPYTPKSEVVPVS